MKHGFLISLVVLVAACGSSSGDFSAEDLLAARAVAGEEEALTEDGVVQEGAPQLPPMRGCDAPGEFAKLFAEADGDQSGALDAPEGRKVRRGFGPPPHVLHLLKWVYDADESGDLDETERAALLADHTARCEALQDRLLADFDADGDGTLSEAELEEARANAPRPPHGHGPRGEGDTDGPPGGRGHHGPRGEGDTDGPPGGRGHHGPPVDLNDPPPPVVDEFDADGDGTLSASEAATARAEIRARLVAGEPPVAPPPPPEE